MTPQEIEQVMNSIPKIDFQNIDMADQLIYFDALHDFATRVQPLVLKYSTEIPSKSTFLFKIGD